MVLEPTHVVRTFGGGSVVVVLYCTFQFVSVLLDVVFAHCELPLIMAVKRGASLREAQGRPLVIHGGLLGGF